MKILKLCWLSILLMAMFLCGCSQSNEDEVRKAKRFEALKGLPLDTVLTRAYKFYEQFQATGDTLLRDSMNDYRDHFFARWELTSDSLCGTVAPDDSLAADLREINEAVSKYFFEYHIKHMYWFMLDTAKRESLLGKVDSTQKVELTAPGWRWDTREEDEVTIMGIPFEEALSVLKKDSTSVFKVVYFIQTLQVHYVDTVAADMNALLKIDLFGIKQSERKEAKSACMEKTPIGQQVLVLNKEYESLLNNFMKTRAHGDRRFLMREIPVLPRFWEDDFSFHSYPTIVSAVFNKNHDMVSLNVSDGYGRGGFYYLSKRSGKWEVVKRRDGWVM